MDRNLVSRREIKKKHLPHEKKKKLKKNKIPVLWQNCYNVVVDIAAATLNCTCGTSYELLIGPKYKLTPNKMCGKENLSIYQSIKYVCYHGNI